MLTAYNSLCVSVFFAPLHFLLRCCFFWIAFSFPLLSVAECLEGNRILFLLQSGQLDHAIECYFEYADQLGRQDLQLVQRIGLAVLAEGSRSPDPEVQLLTLFGAAVSLNEEALRILEEGVRSPLPEIQVVSINALARLQDDRESSAFSRALRSPSLVVRLETLYHMAERKVPETVDHLEALLCKIPPELLPIFPQFFAMVASPAAIRKLRQFLMHPSEAVRLAAIISVARHGCDELLPTIRSLAMQHSPSQQEACCHALGVLEDAYSLPRLEKLAGSSSPFVRLAALQALHHLGWDNARIEIEAMAKECNLYAIASLGSIEGSEDLLAGLTTHKNQNVRINAALALLERQDIRCLKSLSDILVTDVRDLAFIKTFSPSKCLHMYKTIPSAKDNPHASTSAMEESKELREGIIQKLICFPEGEFLRFSECLLETQQGDLIPIVVEEVETLQTPAAVELLKKYQQKIGAPLIRQCCTLALYRLGETGSYAEQLCKWVLLQQGKELIRFKPLGLSDKDPESRFAFQLTPQETSKLLIATFEAMASRQEERGIHVLLEAIQKGNQKNKYALAGLLIRAAS